MAPQRDFDILEMPLQGLAAYWLSVKKLMDGKKGRRIIAEETDNTTEPFIRHLLGVGFSSMPGTKVRRLAQAKRDTMLRDYRRKLMLMRATLMALALKENPRITYVKMISLYPSPPMEEKQAFDMAQGIQDGLSEPGADVPTLLSLDHKLDPGRLMVKLLYYAMRARRQGPAALDKLTPHVKSPYFREGLTLIRDGFDARFVDEHLDSLTRETIMDLRQKMDMATEMCMGIRARLDYDDILLIAHSYMAQE